MIWVIDGPGPTVGSTPERISDGKLYGQEQKMLPRGEYLLVDVLETDLEYVMKILESG